MKFENGFEELNNPQIIDLGDSVLGYVQDLYSLEDNFINEINSKTTIEELSLIDFSDLKI